VGDGAEKVADSFIKRTLGSCHARAKGHEFDDVPSSKPKLPSSSKFIRLIK
jgi:hypothetical protein